MQSTIPKLTIPLSSLAAEAQASAITLHAPQPADLKTINQTLFEVLGRFGNEHLNLVLILSGESRLRTLPNTVGPTDT